MRFPWEKYEELPVVRRPTLQVFITSRCNLCCEGCFARNVMGEYSDISLGEYKSVVEDAACRGCMQINILGGEPSLHCDLLDMYFINGRHGMKTTIYTNGYNDLGSVTLLSRIKVRASLYSAHGNLKSLDTLQVNAPVDICFMVSRTTTVQELLEVAQDPRCQVLFISSLRELDNPRKEFFDDTPLTMPLLQYKELVHDFLWKYQGKKEIHVSKRGVFESTMSPAICHCNFANYFPGGKIIQCPYDIVNQKYQDDYEFGVRPCQQNSTCLMSKVVYRRKK